MQKSVERNSCLGRFALLLFILLLSITCFLYSLSKESRRNGELMSVLQKIKHTRGFIHSNNLSGNSTVPDVFPIPDDQKKVKTDVLSSPDEYDTAMVTQLIERMKPVPLVYPSKSQNGSIPTQLMHLHHMKSGGTSLGAVIRCATNRASKGEGGAFGGGGGILPQYQLSECSYSRFQECVSNPHASCRHQAAKASIMTYCAPLFTSNQLGWGDARAITVLRNPIDRVWSMYRFQTKSCFKCKNLTDVYADINAGRTDTYSGVCASQLSNHITRNLMSLDVSGNITDEDKINDAMNNLRNRFVVVGLLEKLNSTKLLIEHSFPWMQKSIPGSDIECDFPHANASPRNNRCGPKNSHKPIPDIPDEESRAVIEKNNQLDIKLYDAAVEHFEYQMTALSML